MVIKTAWRHIVRQKASAIISVAGLALGLCACLVIFLICDYDLNFDRSHPEGERIYRIIGRLQLDAGHTDFVNNIPAPAAPLIESKITGLQMLSRYYPYWTTTTINNPGRRPTQFDSHVQGSLMSGTILTDAAYFDIFHYTWLAGSPSGEFQKPNRVVISEQRAKAYFGNASLQTLLGRQIVYNDSLRVFIAGIVKDWNFSTDFPFTDFVSLATIHNRFLSNDYNDTDWNARWVQCFVKLPVGIDPAQFSGPLGRFIKTYDKSDPDSRLQLQLQSLADIHFNGELHGEDLRTAHKPTLYGLSGIAGFVLLLAIVNFINLTSAQSLQRMKETGIRKVLGSSRWSIGLQFMIEAGLLTLLATLIAVSLVPVILKAFSSFVPEGIDGSLTSPGRISFISFVMTFTAATAGIYPAHRISSYAPVLSLKGMNVIPGSSVNRLRRSLIVFQFAISIAFIVCALILRSQLNFIRDKDLGLNTDTVISIRTNGPLGQTGIGILEEKIKNIPGVIETAPQILPPVGQATFGLPMISRNKNKELMHIVVRGGNDRFIPFYRIKMLAGQNLRHSDSLDELVINETFARRLGFEHPSDAIGQLLTVGKDNFFGWKDRALPVVGVVRDFTIFSLHESIQPVIIAHIPAVEDKLAVRLSAGGIEGTKNALARIEKVWKELYPDSDFNYEFLDDSIAAMYDKEQRTATLLTVAVLTSISISCIGLFGMMMFSAGTRTREVGIRKVLGASVPGLVLLLNQEYFKLIGLALLISVPCSGYTMSRWLENFVFHVHISAWHFISAGLLIVGIAFLTVAMLTIKTASANPVHSLRSE